VFFVDFLLLRVFNKGTSVSKEQNNVVGLEVIVYEGVVKAGEGPPWTPITVSDRHSTPHLFLETLHLLYMVCFHHHVFVTRIVCECNAASTNVAL
jgi:hypothetical protein